MKHIFLHHLTTYMLSICNRSLQYTPPGWQQDKSLFMGSALQQQTKAGATQSLHMLIVNDAGKHA
jgi:hypothetical protein